MPAARTIRRQSRRFIVAPLVVALLGALASAPPEAAAQDRARVTGLPLPRFVSLKSNDVNVRRGPGQEYDVAFTFVKEGLPVEITQEFDTWRKIRDSDGAEGWVFHSLLSGKRTAIVAPWETSGNAGPIPARASADAAGAVIAYLAPRVIANVEECRTGWCLIGGSGYRGWIEQDRLWGVYPNEEFEE